jgi:hypothetical protein
MANSAFENGRSQASLRSLALSMNRLCTYIIREDTGLAPNPFWGCCTLAVCTPNHQGTRLAPGDFVAGFLDKKRGYRLVYAMEVSEILNLDDYFHDPRFEQKKPNLRGSWKERCGDNFYSKKSDGSWHQHRNRFHLDTRLKEQDTRHARVFIGERFWYRGRKAESVPAEFLPLIGGRGARVNHDSELANHLVSWISKKYEGGIAASPNDNPDMDS